MNSYERAYSEGFNSVLGASFHSSGGAMEKSAALFNFGDSDNGGGGFSLSRILIPLLAAGGAGYIAYNAGMEGDPNRSSFSNIKSYLGSRMEKLFRKRPHSMFNYSVL